MSTEYEYRTRVFCTLQFEGFHRWPNAPDEVDYLRVRHRHIFHVRAEVLVKHDDRDIEFITLKNSLLKFVETMRELDEVTNWSCERWAREIMEYANLDRVEVSEDNENGAIIERIPLGFVDNAGRVHPG